MFSSLLPLSGPRARPGVLAGSPSMPAQRDWSLRNRLLALAAVSTLLAWLAGGAAVLLAAREHGEQLHDARLEDVARVVLQFAGHEIAEIAAERPGEVVHLETRGTLDSRYRYQVWSRTGELLLMSDNTPPAPFAPSTTRGHAKRTLQDIDYRVFVLESGDGTMQIQVAEEARLRELFTGTVDRYWVLFFVASAIGLVLLNAWMFGRTTRALDAAALQLRDRAADDPQPIDVADPPRELQPLLDSLNALFGRFDRALGSERHFTAAAAHELRSSLAAVRLQAQIAERVPQSEVPAALKQLGVCIERATRLVEQLLTLARLDTQAPASNPTTTAVRLEALASRIVAELAPLLEARGIRVTADLKPAEVMGLEFGLSAMLRNLVDNAARYCPPDGNVRVQTGHADGHAFVAVEDSGPGIAADERERVFEPFYRPQSGASEGAGVGFSIVQSVASAHGGRVVLADSDLGGLRVAVYLSVAAPAAAPLAQASPPAGGQ